MIIHICILPNIGTPNTTYINCSNRICHSNANRLYHCCRDKLNTCPFIRFYTLKEETISIPEKSNEEILPDRIEITQTL
jgi:hypothetical protein